MLVSDEMIADGGIRTDMAAWNPVHGFTKPEGIRRALARED
jgi:hypothetical protein